MDSGSESKLVADLHRGGLLPFDPERIDRVDQLDLVGRCDVFDNRKSLVEVPLDLDDSRLVHHRLGELAHGDLSSRDEHVYRQSRPGAIGSSGRRRVSS